MIDRKLRTAGPVNEHSTKLNGVVFKYTLAPALLSTQTTRQIYTFKTPSPHTRTPQSDLFAVCDRVDPTKQRWRRWRWHIGRRRRRQSLMVGLFIIRVAATGPCDLNYA